MTLLLRKHGDDGFSFGIKNFDGVGERLDTNGIMSNQLLSVNFLSLRLAPKHDAFVIPCDMIYFFKIEILCSFVELRISGFAR